MCLESYDIAKGNVDRSDDSLETAIKPRWYAKDKALELCAPSLGMLKDTMHVTTSESIGSVKMRTFHQDSGDSTTDQGCLEETSVWKRRAFRKEIRENQNPNCAVSPSVPGDKTGR
jgi:hypothetical protein